MLNIIATLIKEGYTSGYCPDWDLNIKNNNNTDIDDFIFEIISEQVKEGYICGYLDDINWYIEIKEEEEED